MYSPAYQSGPTKIVGQAFTVKFAAKDDSSAPKLKGNYVCIQRLPTCHSSIRQIRFWTPVLTMGSLFPIPRLTRYPRALWSSSPSRPRTSMPATAV